MIQGTAIFVADIIENDHLPRRALMTSCALSFVAVVLGWTLETSNADLGNFESISFPALALTSAAAFALLCLTGQRFLVRAGQIMLSLWGIYLVTSIANQVFFESARIAQTLVYSIWLPGYTVLTFLIVGRRTAQWISWSVFATVTCMYFIFYLSLPTVITANQDGFVLVAVLLIMQPNVIILLTALLGYRKRSEIASHEIDATNRAKEKLQYTLDGLKAAQEETQAARELLSNTINTIHPGLAVFDIDGKLILSNKALRNSADAIGFPLQSGMNLAQLTQILLESGARDSSRGEPTDGWLHDISQLRNKGRSNQLYMPDGRSFLVFERDWSDGTSVITLTDISKLEQDRETISQLQKMEALGRLTGGIAHDFNNLLSIILGNLEFMQSMQINNEELDILIGETINQTNKGTTLVQQLLAFARGRNLKLLQIDPVTLLQEMLPIIRSAVGEQINVKLAPISFFGNIEVEPDLVQSMVINIALNAKDAMPTGGALSIAVAKESFVSSNPDEELSGSYICLSFSDTGEGIQAEHMQKVFEPFYTTKSHGEGSGLGLSMIYGLVKQFKGDIKISSRPDAGTKVSLFFPIVQPAAKKKHEKVISALSPTMQTFSGSVLLIEDNNELRKVSRLRLNRLGFDVTEAASIQQGKSLFSNGNFVLIFSDVMLPDGNGYDLADELMGLDPETRILLTSGYTELNAKADSTLRPNIPFIQKPHSMADLTDRISALLSK